MVSSSSPVPAPWVCGSHLRNFYETHVSPCSRHIQPHCNTAAPCHHLSLGVIKTSRSYQHTRTTARHHARSRRRRLRAVSMGAQEKDRGEVRSTVEGEHKDLVAVNLRSSTEPRTNKKNKMRPDSRWRRLPACLMTGPWGQESPQSMHRQTYVSRYCTARWHLGYPRGWAVRTSGHTGRRRDSYERQVSPLTWSPS